MKINSAYIGVILILLFSIPSYTQTSNKAISYLNMINEQYEDIRKEMWNYIKTVAHSEDISQIEKKRITLLQTVGKSINNVSNMQPFNNDSSLRDSVVSFLKLNFNVLNEDFAKIINMKEIAEQSYDQMETYLLAQELANKKLGIASAKLDKQYKAFADKYKITLTDNKDSISIKLNRSREALKYYNNIYLIFFEAYKQEKHLLERLEEDNLNAIEPNLTALKNISEEGIDKLEEINHFKGDNSLNAACKKLLNFYIDETKKIPIISDFIKVKKEYNKMASIIESRNKDSLTDKEVNNYNEAAKAYNKKVNKFNKTRDKINNERKIYMNIWSNSVDTFLSQHIPKK